MLKNRLAVYPGRVRLVVHDPIDAAGVAANDARTLNEQVRDLIRTEAECDVVDAAAADRVA